MEASSRQAIRREREFSSKRLKTANDRARERAATEKKKADDRLDSAKTKAKERAAAEKKKASERLAGAKRRAEERAAAERKKAEDQAKRVANKKKRTDECIARAADAKRQNEERAAAKAAAGLLLALKTEVEAATTRSSRAETDAGNLRGRLQAAEEQLESTIERLMDCERALRLAEDRHASELLSLKRENKLMTDENKTKIATIESNLESAKNEIQVTDFELTLCPHPHLTPTSRSSFYPVAAIPASEDHP